MKKQGRSIFHTIFLAMLSVLFIEILLLLIVLYLSRVGERLNQNAIDLLQKQVENRSSYLESVMLDNQNLSSLSDKINAAAESLRESGLIDMEHLGDNSNACLPLMEAIDSDLIEELRSHLATGLFVLFNTQDLSRREIHSDIPCIYLRDLDPNAPASDRNADLLLLRAPAAMVKSMGISTDRAWTPALSYRGLGTSGILYPSFQAAYEDHAQLSASDYGHWTITSYTLAGDDHPAIAYTIPLILSDGTVYGVLGIEMTTAYLQSLLPFWELQNEQAGSYLLASCTGNLQDPEVTLSAACCSTDTGMEAYTSEDTLLLTHKNRQQFLLTNHGKRYYAALTPLSFYNRNAPFSSEQWLLIGAVELRQLFSFSNQVILLLGLSIFLMLIVGLICSLICSRRLARPISRLSAEVAAVQKNRRTIPNLSLTGIRELDQFSTAITTLSRDILMTSTKFLRIMDMASVELGGYEIRFDTGSVYFTDNFFSMLGMNSEESTAMTPVQFQERLQSFTASCPHTSSPSGGRVYRISRPNGETRYLRMEVRQEGQAQFGLIEDVTMTTLERLRIEHERDYDTLTGLYNRQAFQRESESLFSEPKQLKHAALLMLDMDNLKYTNDTYGHDWGDQYIRQAGRCFADYTPKDTLCARISGDEFHLLFYGYESQDEIRKVLVNLREQLHQQSIPLPGGKVLHLSISGGIAWYPEDGTQLDTLKKYADFAMYQIKHSRKGALGEFDLGSYNQEAYSVQARSDLHRLIENEMLSYHFQPIVSARTGQIVAYEALMRSMLPTLKSPDTIMKLAKEENCLHDIERITMFKATEAYLSLQERGLIRGTELLFVNSIASQHMTDEENQEYCRRFAAIQKQIVVEITEEEMLDPASLEVKRGTPGFPGTFALDDYGSGYSSEKNLLELSPKYIKIDLSIIRGIDTDPDKQQIVANIVAYAHPRKMLIIAEGLETPEEIHKVLELDVDLLQGFCLARPAAIPGPVHSDALDVIYDFYHLQ